MPTLGDIRFYIDPETGYPHIHNHGIEEYEVVEALTSPREDRQERDNSRMAIGQTFAGRYLRVIYVRERESGVIFVITAYELRGAALASHRRRMRRRRR